jgi:hypothetical protein
MYREKRYDRSYRMRCRTVIHPTEYPHFIEAPGLDGFRQSPESGHLHKTKAEHEKRPADRPVIDQGFLSHIHRESRWDVQSELGADILIHAAFRIPPKILLRPAGGLAGRIPPSPCCPFILATAPPMLTPGLITPAPPELDPPRLGLSGDMPVEMRDVVPAPEPVLPVFFLIVTVFGI